MNSILRVLGTTKKYGGDLYEDELTEALSREYRVEAFQPVPPTGKVLGLKKYFLNLLSLSTKNSYDFVLRPMNHAFFMRSVPKQVVIAYHYDCSHCHPLVRIHHFLSLKSLVANKDQIHKLIVISKYWQDYFADLGFKNIELLYCGFDLSQFHVSDQEVSAFRLKYGLEGKKVVYIGNAQKKKGADLVYEALKGTDYFMVTSGNKDIDLPVLNLNLSHREYLCLLKSAGLVITYSQFKEGWNRVAHEAMLMGTPVIGSGLGGMGELLSGGGQSICADPAGLKSLVDQLFGSQEVGRQGQEYARQFTIERFNQRALEIFKS